MATPATERTPAELVSAFVKLRDKKRQAEAEYKKSMEVVNKLLEQLEGILLQKLEEIGADSIACEAGTVYRNTQYSATVQDRETFREWVQSTDNWEAVDLRANKAVVRNILDAGEEVPGVKFSCILTVGVRRS